MRILSLGLASVAVMALTACGGGGLANRDRPDEFAVARAAPLVIPPDFALVPPRPVAETQVLQEAGADRAVDGARSVAGDPATTVVDKGATTQTIIAAPEGDGQEARVSTPQ